MTILSCILNGYQFFRERVRRPEDKGHDPSDWKSACEKAMLWGDTIYIGHFFEKARESLEELEPVLAQGGPPALRSLSLTQEQGQRLVDRMM